MSIIKCPECRKQVSTMAGTCPHCNAKISGQLRTCPSCGSYCFVTQDKCPECGSTLQNEAQTQSQPSSPSQGGQDVSLPPRRRVRKKAVVLLVAVSCLIVFGVGGCYYYLQRQQQKEQADYERLEGITNPEFYQQFLNDYPESPHCDEIRERMLVLQSEVEDWEQLLQGINRKSVSRFLKKHPESLRQRLCEDMLDSIDWQDAQTINSEEAVTNYLSKHPSGRYVTEAAEMKNALLLTKATPEERAMIRGVLETFFSKAIANQDIEIAREAIAGTTMNFCGNQEANAEAIVQYAQEKMAKDVIGLHYLVGQQMKIRKETLPDGNTGFSVEVNLQETISRSDMSQPASNLYRVTALLNQEKKIVRLNIFK